MKNYPEGKELITNYFVPMVKGPAFSVERLICLQFIFPGRIGYSVICRYNLSLTHTYVNVDRSYCHLLDVCNKQTDHLFRSELTLNLLLKTDTFCTDLGLRPTLILLLYPLDTICP